MQTLDSMMHAKNMTHFHFRTGGIAEVNVVEFNVTLNFV